MHILHRALIPLLQQGNLVGQLYRIALVFAQARYRSALCKQIESNILNRIFVAVTHIECEKNEKTMLAAFLELCRPREVSRGMNKKWDACVSDISQYLV